MRVPMVDFSEIVGSADVDFSVVEKRDQDYDRDRNAKSQSKIPRPKLPSSCCVGAKS